MPTLMECGCGYILQGDDIEEVLADAENHVRSAHPDLVGTLSPLELAQPAVEDVAAA